MTPTNSLPPPQPLPEHLWGDKWQVASFPAGELVAYFENQPIPFLSLPPDTHPLSLGIASNARLSGIIIEAGRQSMQLAQWLADRQPQTLNYIEATVGESGGLVLTTHSRERWILATFEDSEMATSAQKYEQRKKDHQGLHFLLIQPDNSGMTYSGFWLLKDPQSSKKEA
ncbi:MAG: Tab2 family RNA-binding protein [Microcystaceae cyanobacterium]